MDYTEREEIDPASQGYAKAHEEKLLDAVRAAVNAAGGRRITLAQFCAASGMRHCDVYRHFPGWAETLQAAGFRFDRYYGSCPREAAVTFPTLTTERAEREDVPRVIDQSRNRLKERKPGKGWFRPRKRMPRGRVGVGSRRPYPRSNGRAICGGPLEIGGLRNAPVNEQGVVFLFGVLAERLGFRVEALQNGFPDCEAKRLIAPDVWQTVDIEFEYKSRNFRQHGHPPEGCDMIVCWVHNWPECPKSLEVIALSEEIKRLGSGVASA